MQVYPPRPDLPFAGERDPVEFIQAHVLRQACTLVCEAVKQKRRGVCCAGYGTCDEPQQRGEFTSVRCLGPEEQLKPGQARTALIYRGCWFAAEAAYDFGLELLARGGVGQSCTISCTLGCTAARLKQKLYLQEHLLCSCTELFTRSYKARV